MVLFTLSDGKHQRKKSRSQTQLLNVNGPSLVMCQLFTHKLMNMKKIVYINLLMSSTFSLVLALNWSWYQDISLIGSKVPFHVMAMCVGWALGWRCTYYAVHIVYHTHAQVHIYHLRNNVTRTSSVSSKVTLYCWPWPMSPVDSVPHVPLLQINRTERAVLMSEYCILHWTWHILHHWAFIAE